MDVWHLTKDSEEYEISEDYGIVFLLTIQFYQFSDHRNGVSDVIKTNQPHDTYLIDLLDAGNLHLNA